MNRPLDARVTDDDAALFRAAVGDAVPLRTPLRQRPVALLDGDVTDGEDVLQALDPQVVVDLDAAAASLRHSPVRHLVRCLDARGPDDHTGRDELPVVDDDAVRATLGVILKHRSDQDRAAAELRLN